MEFKISISKKENFAFFKQFYDFVIVVLSKSNKRYAIVSRPSTHTSLTFNSKTTSEIFPLALRSKGQILLLVNLKACNFSDLKSTTRNICPNDGLVFFQGILHKVNHLGNSPTPFLWISKYTSIRMIIFYRCMNAKKEFGKPPL